MNHVVTKKRLEKIVFSGDVVEYFRYVRPIPVEHLRDFDIEKNEETSEGKREDNLYRARGNIRRYIWSNVTKYTKLVTLTYKETVLDYEQINYDFKQFVRRLRRAGFDCPYLWISEHQKSRGEKEGNEGCLHIHALLFIDDFISFDVINKAWGNGFVDIHILRDINNLGAYVCKYLTKEEFNKYHKHCYHISRGLKKPIEICRDGYEGHYMIFDKSVFENYNFHYLGTSEIEYIGADGALVKNGVIYQQGVLKNAKKSD